MKARVSEKGQVTIPKKLRERLGIRPGEVLDFDDEAGRLVARKAGQRDPLDAVYGVLKLRTSVDSNVLLDVFVPDPTFGPLSRDALRRCLSEGGLVACDVMWAEVSATFSSSELAARTLETLGVTFAPLDMKAAALAGDAWRSYRRRGGERERVSPTLSSAHTRDPGRIACLRASEAFTGALSRAYASSNRPRAEVRAVTSET